MKVALASPPLPKTINEGLYWLEELIKEAVEQGAEIICFPESYIPGYHGEGYEAEDPSPEKMEAALDSACKLAKQYNIALILPMDWYRPEGMLNVAFVIAATGEVMGYQSKNQLDPSEDPIWVPGTERSLFEVNGVKFGITICHEGFRYPESVRWSAIRDAKIVFHPHCSGSIHQGVQLSEWGHKNNPYYEKAAMLRAMENTIYFASVNYAMPYQESATALIAPNGACVSHQPYGKTGVFVAEIDTTLATGLLAKRYKPAVYV
jgi:predicted amidohydrolase